VLLYGASGLEGAKAGLLQMIILPILQNEIVKEIYPQPWLSVSKFLKQIVLQEELGQIMRLSKMIPKNRIS
jgi:hypothetical protein